MQKINMNTLCAALTRWSLGGCICCTYLSFGFNVIKIVALNVLITFWIKYFKTELLAVISVWITIRRLTTTTPQPFYGPFSGTTRVSWCQKRTSGLHGARGD